jgi:tetratricopeptide (TPR) repeat protein
VGTKLAGRGFDLGVGVASGAIGGVSGSGFRGGHTGTGHGNDSWVCDPWGWHCSSSCNFFWGASCGWGSFWCPWYWSWYYPCWWWYSRPYYYSDYCFYQPVSTVVYSEPRVIYLERENEPVGEAVVSQPPAQQAGTIAPPAAAEDPLSMAAQRYLELGDRAFREARYTDAVQFYAKAVEFAPDQGALYLVLSDALFASGDYHYGAYAVRRALELDPTLVQSQIDKHGFYPDPKLFDTQLAALESYLNDHPSDRDARLVLALNYLFGARPKDAARVLEGASATMADDPAAQKILNRAHEAERG